MQGHYAVCLCGDLFVCRKFVNRIFELLHLVLLVERIFRSQPFAELFLFAGHICLCLAFAADITLFF